MAETNPRSSTSSATLARQTPRPIRFGVKGTCKTCGEFVQVASTMTEEDEARDEFTDAHLEERNHFFKGDVTVWRLERPAEEQGPDPTVRAYVQSLRDRRRTITEEASTSRPQKIKMVRPR
ncbi:hypothetical protein KKH24_01915 [Patescibacteria group bacterium]|nr:hypothetical protein [Patescibacteria group bacterium]